MLAWQGDLRLVADGTVFHVLADRCFVHHVKPEPGEFLVFKPKPMIERYSALIADLRPRHILELGIDMGGSTALLAELARPTKLVAIDRRPLEAIQAKVHDHAARNGMSDAVRTFGEVDQADRQALAQIVAEEFDGPLDLVIDDCSHLYRPTRESFNELFPRLRPGGVYLIEDWVWAHTALDSEYPEGLLPEEVPLTRLLFEIQLAIPSVPGLIKDFYLHRRLALVTRGDAKLDPSGFDISQCSNPRGRKLLAPE